MPKIWSLVKLSESLKIAGFFGMLSCSGVDLHSIESKARKAGTTEQNSSKVSGTEIGNGKELSGTEVGNGQSPTEEPSEFRLTCIYNPPADLPEAGPVTAKYSCVIENLPPEADPEAVNLDWELKSNDTRSARLVRSDDNPLSFEILTDRNQNQSHSQIDLMIKLVLPGFEPVTIEKALTPPVDETISDGSDMSKKTSTGSSEESAKIKSNDGSQNEEPKAGNAINTGESVQRVCSAQNSFIKSSEIIAYQDMSDWCLNRGGVLAEVYSYQLDEISKIISASREYRIGAWNGDSYPATCLNISDLTVFPYSCQKDSFVLCSCP